MKDMVLLIQREIKKIRQDRNLLMIFILAPIAYSLLYGAIYVNKVETDIPIAVVDYDRSALSRQFIRDVNSHQNIKVELALYNENEIKQNLINEDIHAAIIIPKEFEKNLKFGRKQTIKFIGTPARLLAISDIALPISQIASSFGGKITAGAMMKKGVPITQETSYAQPIRITFQYLHNEYLTYGDLLLPSLLIVILSQIIIIGTAASQAKEWNLDEWSNLFGYNTNIFKIITSKLFVYTVYFAIIAAILLFIVAPIYDIRLHGNIFELYFVYTVGVLSSVSFGMFIGTFFKHRISVFAILGFSTYPMFMMTGYLWSSLQIPMYLQIISNIFPLTPFLQSSMKISQLGMPMSSLSFQMIISVLQIIVFSCLFALRLVWIRRAGNHPSKLIANV